MIYYLGFYDTLENKAQWRGVAPTAANKMTYIISALEKGGHTVEVISPATTMKNKFFKGKTVPIGRCSRLKLFATWPHKSRILRFLGGWHMKIQVFFYMLSHVKSDDTVIVYHSLALMKRVRLLKRLCRFKLIIEAEEIYGDIQNNKRISNKELRYFQIADGYLFPAKQLEQKVNLEHRPYVLIHGTYQAEEDRGGQFQKPEWKDKVHCVYAGTLDPRKGGAALAAKAAMYLPQNYYVHILGAGGKDRIDIIKSQIEEVKQKGSCGVSYDGCLRGESFTRFLQCCQVGLSTQTPDGDYNDTSFPSKILTYMSNGLPVVTVRIPVVEKSAVHAYMNYYEDATPESIAAAIQTTVNSKNRKNGREALFELDEQCVKELSLLLGYSKAERKNLLQYIKR